MTRRSLIIAAAVAALASPLVAADQAVEKATRFRAAPEEVVVPEPPAPKSVSPEVVDIVEDATSELESSAQIEELGGQCCYIWAVNAEQVEELGPYYWNQNAEQVEELGPYYWNQNTDQVEELGCCYYWNQNAAEIED